MIEAIIDGGWKSILTAALLLVMSVMSLSSLLAEILRIRREIASVPTSHEQATGIWLAIQEEYHRTVATGLKGKLLQRRLDSIASGVTIKGGGHATILATVGSNAPYIGLFGTVVGIYGALHVLGLGGTPSPDRIAGPVGEALVMTALGLVVAIPAVLGYNYITSQRTRLTQMAHAYLVWLSTGSNTGPHMRALQARTPFRIKRRKLA